MILGATIKLRDQFTGTMIKAHKSTQQMTKSSITASTQLKGMQKSATLANTQLKNIQKTSQKGINLKIKDNMSNTLRRVNNELETLHKKAQITGRFTMNKLTGGRAGTPSALVGGALAGGLTAAAGAATAGIAATVAGIGYGITKSIQMAAELEQQMITMSTLLGSEKKAKEFVTWGTQEANIAGKSQGEMIQTMTNLSPFAKDLPIMKKYVRMTEILTAINPAEGMAGATFALKEALSGDFVSLQERFNLPRSTINALKEGATTSEDFYNVVEKAAESQGFTYELVKRQGKSALGLWSKMKGQMSFNLMQMGRGLLKGITPALQTASSWMDKNGPTMAARAEKIGTSISDSFRLIKDVALKAWPVVSEVITTTWGIVGPVFSVIKDAVTTVYNMFAWAWPAISSVVKTAWAIIKPIFEAVAWGLGKISSASKWIAEKSANLPRGTKPKGHAAGLSYVPYDNYPALLHRGETVLARRDADHYRTRGAGVTQNINIAINGVQDPKQITREVISELTRELKQAAVNRGKLLFA